MKLDPILNKNDLPFFTLLGITIACSMFVADKISLPIPIDRGFLSKIYFDHIPFYTIVTLIFILTCVVLLARVIQERKVSDFIKQQCIHLSNKIFQLCSPAFFITIGLTLGVSIIGILSKNTVYFGYAFGFIFFSLMILAISIFSWSLMNNYDDIHKKLTPIKGVASCLIMLIVCGALIYFDDSPQKIELSLSKNEYNAIKMKAAEEGISIEMFLNKKIRALELKHN